MYTKLYWSCDSLLIEKLETIIYFQFKLCSGKLSTMYYVYELLMNNTMISMVVKRELPLQRKFPKFYQQHIISSDAFSLLQSANIIDKKIISILFKNCEHYALCII